MKENKIKEDKIKEIIAKISIEKEIIGDLQHPDKIDKINCLIRNWEEKIDTLKYNHTITSVCGYTKKWSHSGSKLNRWDYVLIHPKVRKFIKVSVTFWDNTTFLKKLTCHKKTIESFWDAYSNSETEKGIKNISNLNKQLLRII